MIELLTQEERNGFAKEWLEVQAEDIGVLTKHKFAPELSIETLLSESVDATAEAALLMLLDFGLIFVPSSLRRNQNTL